MAALSDVLLTVGAISFALLAGSVVWSILWPARRIWPPPEGVRWKTLFTGVLTKTGQAGLLLAGLTGFGTLSLSSWVQFALGGSLLVSGGLLARWGIRTLGWQATHGNRDEFIASGPYRFTRNPQYVGASAGFFGYALVCASTPAVLVAAVGAVWFVLMPLAEEPWLREQYGEAFEAYAASVRRYL